MLQPSPIIHPAVQDPFSANSKATRPPPSDELNPITPPTSPSRRYQDLSPSQISPRKYKTVEIETEAHIWEKAIASAIDGPDSSLDLNNRNLTYIPPTISDLSNLVVLGSPSSQSARTFSRAATAPAATAFQNRLLMRATSIAPRTFAFSAGGKEESTKNAVQLYLANNNISVLPKELFALKNVVVLSLRGNNLKHIPPAIAKLHSLREMNIAFNQLTFLPSEFRLLTLTSLYITPNPFIKPPADILEHMGSNPLSPLKVRLPNGPPLTELCIRVLLTPPSARQKTPLEMQYEVTHDHRLLRYSHIFSASTSWAAERAQAKDASFDVTSSACPSPNHLGFRNGKLGVAPRFWEHAEERFEFVTEIAGVRLSDIIPIRWRGCNRGCLSFLEVPAVSDDDDLFGFDGE